MFCSECGQKAQGKFCSNCGHRLAAPPPVPLDEMPTLMPDGAGFPGLPSEPAPRAAIVPSPPTVPGMPPMPHMPLVSHSHALSTSPVKITVREDESPDWEHEVRYKQLLRVPQVRACVQRHAKLAQKGMTGEQFLGLCDKLMPLGVPMEKLATVIQPLYASLGIRTGKRQAATIDAPVGRVIVRILCSLVRHGQTPKGLKQGTDGCFIQAVLPSDLFSLAGDFLITIERRGETTHVQAATNIGGQFFDWGKSTRVLERFFSELWIDPV